MPTKQILFNEENRKAILKGFNIVADAVGSTLGACGKPVTIGRKYGTATSKDGVTVANSINLEDIVECIGANMIKDVARKTVKEAGDSTTGSVVLARAILVEGNKLVSAGNNSIDIKKGIDKSVDAICEEIKRQSIAIEIDSDKLKQIATISANNDAEIGGYVSEAIQKTGVNGVVTIENSQNSETSIKIVDGLEFDRGYINQLFVNNPEKLSCEFENPYILVAEGKLISAADIMPIFEKIATPKPNPFVIIAEHCEGEALHVILHNRIKGNYPICVIKAPSFGENQKRMLQDIAVCVGADVANDETGMRLDTLKLANLGRAKKVIVTKDKTTIINGEGEKHNIESHISQVRKALELSTNELERKQNEERLAKLLGGVGVIHVGGNSEIEINEKIDRYDDALRASKCALEEGVVAGGGVTYIRCIEVLNGIETENEAEKAGVKLMQKVLEAPFIQMAKNAGLENKISISEVLRGGENWGYNFKTNNFENLIKTGVIDPAKVLKSAIKNAASVAGTLLTSEVLIVNEDTPLPQNMQR